MVHSYARLLRKVKKFFLRSRAKRAKFQVCQELNELFFIFFVQQTLNSRIINYTINNDDFAKSPSAALRRILSHCLAELGQAGVHASTTHSFVFARLASETFYFVV